MVGNCQECSLTTGICQRRVPLFESVGLTTHPAGVMLWSRSGPRQSWGQTIQHREQGRLLRVKLLASSARITLFLAVLGFMLVGDPEPGMRAAMESCPSPLAPQFTLLWAAARGRLAFLRPAPALNGTPTPEPTPTLSPTPIPTRVPANGPPTWIEAPAIHLSAPVVEVGWRLVSSGDTQIVEWEVPDNAAGFHKGSAYPGHPGNTVISGHHNMGGEVFRYLVDLNIGDQVLLYVDKTPYRYRIVQKEIVREFGVSEQVRRENGRWIAPTDDERLTLVTCWPYSSNSHRLILVAKPIP